MAPAPKMFLMWWALDAERRPVPCANIETWKRMMGVEKRVVAKTDVAGGSRVSTVFLGVDHRHFGGGPPLLFETMIFGGPLDLSCWRYASWDDAEVGHAMAVKACLRRRPSSRARSANSIRDRAAHGEKK